MAIGTDEAASAELDAAEIACNDNDDIGELIFFEGFENRISGSAAGLTIIVGFLQAAFGTQNPGGSVMACIKIFFFDGADKILSLLFGFDMSGMSKKTGALDFIFGFSAGCDCFVVWHRTTSCLFCLLYFIFTKSGKRLNSDKSLNL